MENSVKHPLCCSYFVISNTTMPKKRGSQGKLQKDEHEGSESSKDLEELGDEYEEYDEEVVDEDEDTGEFEYEEDESLEEEDVEEDDELQGSDFGDSFRNDNEQSYSGGFDQSFSGGFGDSYNFGASAAGGLHFAPEQAPTAPGESGAPSKRRPTATKSIPKSQTLDQPPFCCREGEVDLLCKTIERVSLEWMENPPEVAWICGPSGCGKSTLVREVGMQFFKEAFLIRGTFEEHTMAVKPFKGLTDCLNDLCVRMETNGGMSLWEPRLSEALGGEGPLLSTIVPKILPLMGITQEVDRQSLLVFDPNMRRRFDRLGYAIRDLLRTVSEYHPIVMVLDNVHWADPDSLKMMRDLVLHKSCENFLLIGCHEPIGDNHSLSMIQQEVSTTEIRATSLDLFNFHAGNTREILFSMLAADGHVKNSDLQDEKIATLSDSVQEKTQGNPLYIIELLRAHNENEVLKWSAKFNVWKWSTDKLVQATQESPNTLKELIREQVRKQSKKLKLVVSTAALGGLSHFRVDTLLSMIESLYKQGNPVPCPIKDLQEVEHFLRIAVKKSLVKRTTKTGYYKFAHDIVRQACFDLTPAKKRGQLHFRIGLELSKLAIEAGKKPNGAEERERLKYMAVDQLHRSVHGISDGKQRAKVSKLYMEAAECAIVKSAFRTAMSYLERGIALLAPNVRWGPENYELMSAMHLVLARMKYCCGEPLESETICKDLLDTKLKNLKDKMLTYRLMITISMDKEDYDTALSLILDVLAQLGIRFPTENVDSYVSKEVNRIRSIVQGMKNEQLLNLPRMTDKKALDIMFALYYLSKMGAHFDDSYHQEVACIRMMHVMLKAGYCRVTPLAYSLFSVCLADFNLHKDAYRIGRIAERLSKAGDTYSGQALANFHAHVSHWRRPYKKNLEPLLQNYNDQLDSGDFDHAPLSIRSYIHHHIASGCDLEQLVDNLSLFQGLFDDYGLKQKWMVTVPMKMVHNLVDEDLENPFLFFGEDIDEQNQIVKEWEDGRVTHAVEEFYFLSMVMAIFFQDYEAAEEMQMMFTKEADGVWIPFRSFFHGMILVSKMKKCKGKKRLDLSDQVDVIIDKLTELYNGGATHIDPMIEILKAEELVASGGKGLSALRVRKAYDDAIQTAVEEKLSHLEALANERAGIHFVTGGMDGWSSQYFTQAYKAYQKWGAYAKVADLETQYGHLLDLDGIQRTSKKRVAETYKGQTKKPFTEIELDMGGDESGNPQEQPEDSKKGLKGLMKKAKKKVTSTNRKAKQVFQKNEKLESNPAPWGWNSAGGLQLDEEDEPEDNGKKGFKSFRFGKKNKKNKNQDEHETTEENYEDNGGEEGEEEEDEHEEAAPTSKRFSMFNRNKQKAKN